MAGTEGARVRIGEDRKRDRGNSCTVVYKAQKTLSRSGNYWRIWGNGAIQSDFCLKKRSFRLLSLERMVGEQQ